MSYPSYPEYKKSGLDWFGDVPSHWEFKKISWDLPYQVGWTPPSGNDKYYDGDLPWVTIADMTADRIQDTQTKITQQAVLDRGAEKAPAGSMLFSFKLSVGSVAFLEKAAYTNEAIAAFLPNSSVDLKFWQYAAPIFISQYGRENIYGALLLNQELIGSVRFFAPPYPEQTQIARFLDHQTARIDALIAEQQRLIELLKEKRRAVIAHAVTKGLDPGVAMKDSGVEWLGEVPAHWDVTRVKWVAKLESGHTPSKSIPEYWEDCDIPWVSLNDSKTLANNDYIENTVTEINALGMANSAAHILPRGTVVFTRDATIGLTAITTRPMAVSQHLIAWVCRDQILPEFLLFIFYAMEEELQRSTAGATIKTIGMPEVRKMVTTVPSVDEQESIVEHIFKRKQQLEETEAEAESFIKLLKERRSALISAAVTGKIDVRDWAPPVSDTFTQSAASEEAPA